MRQGHICAAGLDLESGRHVRPVLRGGANLDVKWLKENGGPFEIGAIVDLGRTTPAGRAPEVEDQTFYASNVRASGAQSELSLWGLLRQSGKPSLSEIFGPELLQRGPSSCGVDIGKGTASLGSFHPARLSHLYVRPRPGGGDQVRMKISDDRFDLDLSVTDIRLFSGPEFVPNLKVLERASKRLEAGEEVILSVGLTRPFAASLDKTQIHWLQINNLHFRTKHAPSAAA